jgi:uncharacterized spore protein YtfJ
MSTKISELVNTLLDGVHGISKSETIIGQPQQAGEATVIPVHRLKIAFGAGNAKAGAHAGKAGADTGGQGAGGAVELDPVAAIAVGKDGHAHLLTVDSDAVSSWSQLLAEVPDLVARLAHTVGDRVTLELKTRGLRNDEGLNSGAAHGALPEKSESKK